MHPNPAPKFGFPLVVPSIPLLPESGIQMGSLHHLSLEVSGGKGGRVRLSAGELLHVQVTLYAPSPLAKVRVWTNVGPDFPAPSFHWEEMQADANKNFLMSLPTHRPGSFYFTLQYTLDGQQWYWQRGDFWQVRVFPRQLRSLRLYTLIPTASGPIESWEKPLKEAADLNFNMVHILPLTRQGASQSPYAAADLFALDPDLRGTEAAALDRSCLEKLVVTAQTLGIGLCLDLVLNHVAFDSDLAKRCPHWIESDPLEVDGFKRAGFMTQEGFQKWNDLVLIHYNHPDIPTRSAIWDYMKHYARFWASYAAATQGMIRLDNLHSTPVGFAMHLTQELRQDFPQLGILGELFTTHEETQQILEHYEIDLLLATTWEHHFAQELRHYFYYLHESRPHIPWFTPVNSHDSGVPAEEFTDVRTTAPRYILASLLGTGSTGHTQGVENGILHKIEFIGRQAPIDLPSKHADFRALIKKANELLARYSAFQEQGNLSFIDANHPAIIAGLRRPRDAQEPIALVIVNLDIHQKQRLELDMQSLGLGSTPLWDPFTERTMGRHGPLLLCELEPCEFLVLLAGDLA